MRVLDFWVSRGREADREWSFLFNLSVDKERKKNVGCFLVFSFFLFLN